MYIYKVPDGLIDNSSSNMGKANPAALIVFPKIQRRPKYHRWLGAILAKGDANKKAFLGVDKSAVDKEWEQQAKARWPYNKKFREEGLEQVFGVIGQMVEV